MPKLSSNPFRRSRASGFALALLLAGFAPAHAVDSETSTDAPDLSAVRASIKAKDFKTALSLLDALVDNGVQHADVYNLMGFSYRKSGDLQRAASFYGKALDFDVNHKGALEYQGEMFLVTGQIDKAKANLARLAALCPQGCEEREDLEKSIAAGKPAH